MMETNRSEIKALKDAFRATITEEQKQLIRERRSKMKKRMENIKDRKKQLKEHREDIKKRKKKKRD
jgi:hypothetical protein